MVRRESREKGLAAKRRKIRKERRENELMVIRYLLMGEGKGQKSEVSGQKGKREGTGLAQSRKGAKVKRIEGRRRIEERDEERIEN